MNSFKNLFAIVAFAALAGCGGGGSSGSEAGGTGGTTVACPDGSSAASSSACPAVVAVTTALPSLAPADLNKGISVSFSGALDPSSVKVTFTQGSMPMLGTTTLADGNKRVVFNSAVLFGFSQADKLVITATDVLGRPVSATFEFTTTGQTCTSNAIWSNPAAYSSAVQGCVAPIGVQVLTNSTGNKLQDSSCTFTVGAAMSADCKKYAANGTLLFSETGVIVQNDPTLLVAFFGQNGAGNLVLLDKTTLVTLSTATVSSNFPWFIGNPTGAAVRIDGATRQLRYDGSAIQFN